jgi:tetratricopeptide (TPR) repeat protein
MRRLVLQNQEGVVLLYEGRAREALEKFEHCLEEAKRARLVPHQGLYEANSAAALLELGEPDRAARIAHNLLQRRDFEQSLAEVWGNIVAIKATAELSVESPDLDAVTSHLDEYEPKLPRAQRAMVLMPRVIVQLRHGQFSEAAAFLDERWTEAEASLRTRHIRRLHMLRAFALHRAGKTGEAQEHRTAAGKDFGPDVHFARHWPELAEYLGASGSYRDAAP